MTQPQHTDPDDPFTLWDEDQRPKEEKPRTFLDFVFSLLKLIGAAVVTIILMVALLAMSPQGEPVWFFALVILGSPLITAVVFSQIFKRRS